MKDGARIRPPSFVIELFDRIKTVDPLLLHAGFHSDQPDRALVGYTHPRNSTPRFPTSLSGRCSCAPNGLASLMELTPWDLTTALGIG
jgi:hypothetical protein